MKALLDHLPPVAGRACLELGCGTGLTSYFLRQRGGTWTSCDFERDHVRSARQLVGERVVQIDEKTLPFPTASFDVVACQFGLMFVPDKPLALREMARVLRPGGLLLLSTWDDVERNPASKLLHELAYATSVRSAAVHEGPVLDARSVALRALVEAAGFPRCTGRNGCRHGRGKLRGRPRDGLRSGNPLWAQLLGRGIDAAALQAEVTAALAGAFGAAPCKSPLSAHVVTAVA
jgi:SAM-dependent methyltransferase